MSTKAVFDVNDLVVLTQDREGIIRYKGTVHGHKGTFYGIEMTVGSGDCNGKYKGKQYFSCAAKKGKFVPMKSILSKKQSDNISPPSPKRRKLLNDEYIPPLEENTTIDNEEYEVINSSRKRKSRTKSDKNSNTNNDVINISDSDSDNENTNNNINEKYTLTAQDERELKLINHSINSLNVSSLKSFMKKLQNLLNTDNVQIFTDCSLKGKKADLNKRIKDNIQMIYERDIKDDAYTYSKREYKQWKAKVKQFVLELTDRSGNVSLRAMLSAYEKSELIGYIEQFFSNQNDAELLQEFKDILPPVNLQPMFKKHQKLVNAIFRAMPHAKYGSNRDNYAYNRCSSAISAAKSEIISDGNRLMATKNWNVCLDFIVDAIDRVDSFPTWDNDSKNHHQKDLKKRLNKMYQTVEANLGFGVSEEQEIKLQKLETFFENEE